MYSLIQSRVRDYIFHGDHLNKYLADRVANGTVPHFMHAACATGNSSQSSVLKRTKLMSKLILSTPVTG